MIQTDRVMDKALGTLQAGICRHDVETAIPQSAALNNQLDHVKHIHIIHNLHMPNNFKFIF